MTNRAQQLGGSAIADILNPKKDDRKKATRDFAKENVRAMRQKQSEIREQKMMSTMKPQPFKMQRFAGVQSKVSMSGQPVRVVETKQEFLRRADAEFVPPKEPYQKKRVRTKPSVPSAAELPPRAEPEPARDFIKANTMAAIRNESAGPRRVGSAKGSQGQQRGSSRGSPRLSLGGDAGAGAGAGAGEASSGTAGAAALNKNFGRVPQYLVDRKIEKAEQEAAKEEAAKAAQVPAGMVKLGEEERVRTLAKLQEVQQKLVNDLARFPLTVETETRKRQKLDLENKLKETEEAVKMFSKKVVYIKP